MGDARSRRGGTSRVTRRLRGRRSLSWRSIGRSVARRCSWVRLARSIRLARNVKRASRCSSSCPKPESRRRADSPPAARAAPTEPPSGPAEPAAGAPKPLRHRRRSPAQPPPESVGSPSAPRPPAPTPPARGRRSGAEPLPQAPSPRRLLAGPRRRPPSPAPLRRADPTPPGPPAARRRRQRPPAEPAGGEPAAAAGRPSRRRRPTCGRPCGGGRRRDAGAGPRRDRGRADPARLDGSEVQRLPRPRPADDQGQVGLSVHPGPASGHCEYKSAPLEIEFGILKDGRVPVRGGRAQPSQYGDLRRVRRQRHQAGVAVSARARRR